MIVCGGDVDCISYTKILAMAQSVGIYSGLLIFAFICVQVFAKVNNFCVIMLLTLAPISNSSNPANHVPSGFVIES